MVKNIIVYVVVLIASVCGGVLRAEDLEPIYVVDLSRVMKESIVGRAAIHEMDEEKNKQLVGLEKLQADIKALQDSIEKQSAILSQSALEEKRDQLVKKQRELSRNAQDVQAALLKKNEARVKKALEQIDAVVKEVAKEKKAQFILDNDPRIVVFANDRLELTEEVIERLDDKAKS